MNYQGKIVIVTGAANGIGKVISLEFLKLGATVVGLILMLIMVKIYLLDIKKQDLKPIFIKLI